MNDMTFDHFKSVLKQWDKHLEISFHAKTSGTYFYRPSEFVELLWDSLSCESPNIDDLFDAFIAGLQLGDFCDAYSSPEKLLELNNFTHGYDCNMNPHRAIQIVGDRARRQIIKDGLLDSATIVYQQAITIEQQRKTEPVTRRPKPGFVYFVKSDSGKVKIGRTANLRNRIKSLIVNSPSCSLVHFFESDDSVTLERKFHELFAKCRLGGEWFEIDEDVLVSLKNGSYDYMLQENERL